MLVGRSFLGRQTHGKIRHRAADIQVSRAIHSCRTVVLTLDAFAPQRQLATFRDIFDCHNQGEVLLRGGSLCRMFSSITESTVQAPQRIVRPTDAEVEEFCCRTVSGEAIKWKRPLFCKFFSNMIM